MSEIKKKYAFTADDAWELTIKSAATDDLNEREEKELKDILIIVARNASYGNTSCQVAIGSYPVVQALQDRGFNITYSSNSDRYYLNWGRGTKGD